METQKKAVKTKPKYNLFQNSAFMLALGWREHKSVVLLCVAIALLGVGVNLMELLLAPTVLGKVESSVPLSELFATIALFTLVLLILRAARAYADSNVLFGRVHVRLKLVRRIDETFASASFPHTEDPEVIGRYEKCFNVVNSNQAAGEHIWTVLTTLAESLLGFAVYLAFLSAVDPFLLLIAVLTSAAAYFGGKRFNGWGYRHCEEENEHFTRMNYINNRQTDPKLAKDIRIFGMRPWLTALQEDALALYRAFIVRGERVYIWARVISLALTFLRNGVAYIYLLDMTLREGLPASEFLLYFSAIGGFTAQITSIFEQFSVLHRESLELSALREFFELPRLFHFEDGEKLEPVPDGVYEIRLSHVSFRYPGAQTDTLHDINLTIRPGEKLAVVGLNGAGKTTLVKLICGFYDPTEGEVLLNGVDIRRYDRRDYYRHFSAVFQQFSVLASTLAENVAQCVEGIDKTRVRACIRQAGLDEAVAKLPHGIETHIGREVYEDGVELSGGELQRLMLARALYKDAPLVVLDEPTAALDPIAESEIYEKYNNLTRGRSAIFISHRLASTRFCDRILFIADGGIAEEGSHEALLKRAGRYAGLFEIQSRYYQEGGKGNGED